MKIRKLHSWDLSTREALEIQKVLMSGPQLRKLPSPVRSVAGADISCSKKSDTIWAGVAVFTYPGLVMIEEKWVRDRTGFPYIPGLLSFREVPALLRVIEKLDNDPDLILCDGQGIAHPRRLGLASHLGLFLDRPTIGCAKSRLVGEFSEVGNRRGDYSPLQYRDQVVGGVLRTREGVKPLFISPGNGITLEESLSIVISCCPKYRIPEPIRQAHLLVNGCRKREE
jgi:deoxyribonuclease V